MFRHFIPNFALLACGCGLVLIAGCGTEERNPGQQHSSNPTDITSGSTAAAPAQEKLTESSDVLPLSSEWTDHGEIFTAGRNNQWDHFLWGGFGATVVEKDGVTFLYYQGADGFDEVEATVTNRTLGVAVSTNHLDFVKYAKNPVLTWSPHAAIEEGAVSAAAFLREDGTIRFHFGANTAISSSQVTADGRVADSADGYEFTDGGVVLGHTDSRVWGSGDELFPVLAFEEGASQFVYYIPNGTAQTGQLGVIWGPTISEIANSQPVLAAGSNVEAWGPAGSGRLSASQYAIFVSSRGDAHQPGWHIDAYLVDPADPSNFEGPVQVYDFENVLSGTVRLDHETATWYLYYRNADASAYGVMTAPLRTIAPDPVPKDPREIPALYY